MCRIGLSVPPGFTISTDVCAAFHEVGALPQRTCLSQISCSTSAYALLNSLCSSVLLLSTALRVPWTSQCSKRLAGDVPDDVWNEVLDGVAQVERMAGTKLGDASNPLLISIRSGAAVRTLAAFETPLVE